MQLAEPDFEKRARFWKIAFVASIVLNVVLAIWLFSGDDEEQTDVAATKPAQQVETVVDEVAEPESAPDAPPAVVDSTGEPPTAERPVEREICASVEGSLTQTFQSRLDATEAEWLTAHVARILMWRMNMTRDFKRGDRIAVSYRFDGTIDGMLIHALDLRGEAVGTVRALRYQVEGEPYPRYFDEQGAEIQLQLVKAPIRVYEQVTDQLGGARHHDGVDFKAPVGTEVYSPFDGTILRKNWNWKYNGNCLEIDYPGERLHGIYLHMEKFDPGIGPGVRVRAGQKIGYVGNTGRTTSAHLHYQLNKNGKPVNPFAVQKTFRRKLEGDALAKFLEAAKPAFERLEAIPCDGRD